MLTYVEFRSTAFPAYDGESYEINPGRFGKRLAEYLSAELQASGERVGVLVAEDWGWVIPIENPEFKLWVGVGNYEEHPDGFLCFIEPHTEHIWRFWKRIPTRERIAVLQQRMAAALEKHSEIREVMWQTHEEFHRGAA